MTGTIKGTRVDLGESVPSGAKRVHLRYSVAPPSSKLLIYRSLETSPVIVSGTGDIWIDIAECAVYVQKSADAKDFNLSVDGYEF